MARRWMGVVLLAGWLGVSASARAQYPMPPASGDVPPHAYDDVPPHAYDDVPPHGFPGPAPGPAPAYAGPELYPPLLPPPPVDGPMSPGELAPANSFSNVHPDQVTRSPRFYLGAEYLLWWVRKDQVPTLATSGSLNDAVPAALGQAGTTTLLGPGGFGADNSSGARVTAFYWFDQDHTLGLDASAFWLAEVAKQAEVSGNGDPSGPVVARPFFNPNAGAQDADPIAVPGIQSGSLLVKLQRRFMGADANLRCSECIDITPFSRVTFLAGVRTLYLDENLLFSESENDLPDSDGNPGNSVVLHDNFQTFNRFYGGQVGFETESRVGPLVFTLAGKVALGETYQTVKIGGDTTVVEPDGTVIYDPTRGLLVQPSNLGRFTHHSFSVVPEVASSLAWEFNEHLRVSVGYNFLFWSNVLRPGEQIDTVVNVGSVGDTGQLGSVARPGVQLNTTGFWAQGVSAGLLVSY